jgi:hypothetical protein
MIVARIAPAANAAPDPKPPFEIPAKVTAKAAVAKKTGSVIIVKTLQKQYIFRGLTLCQPNEQTKFLRRCIAAPLRHWRKTTTQTPSKQTDRRDFHGQS